MGFKLSVHPPQYRFWADRERQEILPFTALRGLAAWWVVAFHTREFLPAQNPLEGLLSRGALAVDLFFVMSGFVIALSYGGDFLEQVRLRSYMRFIGLRLARIYPVHILLLVSFLTVPLALYLTDRPFPEGQLTVGYFVASIFLVQNWGFSKSIDWNVPAWSISTELMFYIIFPFIVFAYSRIVRNIESVVVMMVVTLCVLASEGDAASGLTMQIARFGLVRCLLDCLLGVLLLQLSCHVKVNRPARHGLLFACAGLLALYGLDLAADQFVVPLAFVLLLWAVLEPGFWLSRALANPVLLWLGKISYSTYLVHFLLKYWVKFLLGGRVPPWTMFPLYAGLVLAASVILYHLVEVSGRRFGHRLVRKAWPDQTRIMAVPSGRPRH